MKKSLPFALCLVLGSVGLLTSCSSGGGSVGADLFGDAAAAAAGLEDGFDLTADPAEIVIDLTDPSTPTNQDGKAYATIDLTATALDDLGSPLEGLEVTFTTTDGTLVSESNPVLTDAEGLAFDTLTVLEDDDDSIDVTATDGVRIETITLVKTVIFPNQPPVADAGMDLSAECAGREGTPVTLDGSGSTDPDSTEGTNDDIVSFEWFEDYGTAQESRLGEGMILETGLGLGTHVITLLVTDSEGLTDTDELIVDIVDTTDPTLSIEVDPWLLWPPNHKLHEIEIRALAEDTCSDVTVTLISVTSNEADNGLGDGDTDNDIQGADEGSEDYSFKLRAERAGGGTGRVYTVTYGVQDTSGNGAEASAEVIVPHDRSL